MSIFARYYDGQHSQPHSVQLAAQAGALGRVPDGADEARPNIQLSVKRIARLIRAKFLLRVS